MIWQKLQNVLPLIGVIAVVLLPIPAALEKGTVTVVTTHHALEIFTVAVITVRGILGLELVMQTAALMHPCCVIMFLKVPNLFFN